MFKHSDMLENVLLKRREKSGVFWPLILLIAIGCLPVPGHAQKLEKYRKLWEDPALMEKIDNNIETFRKQDAVIKVVSEDGEPLAGAQIQVKQLTHEFLFGCNLFMLKGFSTEKENRKYETAFLKINNFATVPFYWSDLEPEQGKVRFGKDSEVIYRRPPPDLCVEWATEHNVTLKGHPLAWHSWYPGWLPDDRQEVTRLLADRFAQIARRYAKRIKIWDVVNESLVRPVNRVLPEDYLAWSFKEADRRFGPDNTLMINEVTRISHKYLREDSQYYLQIMNLKLRGIRFDGIGFQFHTWSINPDDIGPGKDYDPWQLLDTYALYGRFGKPLYITEITIPTAGEGKQAQEMQAYFARNLYRLWFSVPRMAGITWWNLADGTAYGKENKQRGGLLDEQLEPKASYQALDRLINHDWKTATEGETSANGIFSFRGFCGQYAVTVKYKNITKGFSIDVSRDKDVYHPLILKERFER